MSTTDTAAQHPSQLRYGSRAWRIAVSKLARETALALAAEMDAYDAWRIARDASVRS